MDHPVARGGGFHTLITNPLRRALLSRIGLLQLFSVKLLRHSIFALPSMRSWPTLALRPPAFPRLPRRPAPKSHRGACPIASFRLQPRIPPLKEARRSP